MIIRHLLRRACHRGYASSTASVGNPKIAIIGSGPAGLYSCAALLSRLPTCEIHVIDKSAVPFGLVSFGVAPDHADMKKCANAFERMFDANTDRLRLFGNVAVGSDVTYDQLCACYDALILAYGASRARNLELPNVEARYNCFSGSAFVSWYNGQLNVENAHTPQLDGANAVIIGAGNVAIDCARFLLSPAERFRYTDIPDYAYQQLRRSRVQNVRILARRGPIEASFTIKELRELLNLDAANVGCKIDTPTIADVREKLADSSLPRPRRRILELMLSRQFAESKDARRNGEIVFHRRPETIELNAETTRIETLKVQNASTNETIVLPCDLLIYAIGFTGFHPPDFPLDATGEGLRLRDWCRVDESRTRVYATGWCAKAGSGVIADTQRNAALVADEVRADWEIGRLQRGDRGESSRDVPTLLARAGHRHVSWRDWKAVDRAELERGAAVGKPREKIADVLAFLREQNLH